MLVLSRKKDETIIINGNIAITVVEIRGDKVRIGITAPREISVHRQEVHEAIQKANAEKAAQEAPAEAPPIPLKSRDRKPKGGKS